MPNIAPQWHLSGWEVAPGHPSTAQYSNMEVVMTDLSNSNLTSFLRVLVALTFVVAGSSYGGQGQSKLRARAKRGGTHGHDGAKGEADSRGTK